MWEEEGKCYAFGIWPFATRTETKTERTYSLVLLLTVELLEIGAESERVKVFLLCF